MSSTSTDPRPADGWPEEWGSPRLEMTGDAGLLRHARHRVDGALRDVPEPVRAGVVLMADELITNAVVHGGGWFLLHLDMNARRVRVAVTDANAGRPRVLRLDDEREHGRGMAIVEAMSSSWGTNHFGSHKVVWFELVIAA